MDVRLWRRPATLTHDVTASTHAHHRVDRLFLEIEEHGVAGFGEVTPLANARAPDPSVDDVVANVIEVTAPRLISFWHREGRLPEWSRVHLWAGGSAPSAWAGALLEMALLDFSLVQNSAPVARVWPGGKDAPILMATTSLIDVDDEWRVPDGATRVRAKVARDLSPEWALDRAAAWSRPVVLDFNGLAGDAAVVLAWAAAARGRVDLVAIEQPFAAADLASHALLARETDVTISLDESVTSAAVVRLIARHGAAGLVCVKPPRLGGLAAARHALAEATAWGLRAYVGGFFESPLARRTHAVVAAAARAEASDVAPVPATGDEDDVARTSGLGTVPGLSAAKLVASWEIG